MADGSPTPFDHRPSLEDSIEQQQMAIGSVSEVVELIEAYRDRLGVEHLVCFFDMPGLTREQMDEQLTLMATEVAPRLGVTMTNA
jgi:alkanesulfonate monooxygenase SsuD/methylene tetrahydromethanopterin reductase-like flavin-dependent oxidoreductase (luciferase family)